MYVADSLKNNVAFVGFMRDGEPDWRGTAFLVGTPTKDAGTAFHYMVTAKHVIEQIDRHSADKKVLLRINHTAADAHIYETSVKDWVFHPDNSSVDVAVAPVWLGPLVEMTAIPLEVFRVGLPSWVRAGTEVFFPGLFHVRTGERRNVPVVRVGVVAALPEEPIFLSRIGTIDAYLIEARSIGGLSGSPVFAYRETPTGRFASDWEVFWIGLMHGHFDTTAPLDDLTRRAERVNMGLAVVVPGQDVLGAVDQPHFRKQRLAEGAPF
jgi:hypothetical protein